MRRRAAGGILESTELPWGDWIFVESMLSLAGFVVMMAILLAVPEPGKAHAATKMKVASELPQAA
jgi:hypothetical protein